MGHFFAGDDIGLALPTNLLGMDGLKQGGLFLSFMDLFSPLLERLVLMDASVGRQFSWLQFATFYLPFFGPFFWLIGA